MGDVQVTNYVSWCIILRNPNKGNNSRIDVQGTSDVSWNDTLWNFSMGSNSRIDVQPHETSIGEVIQELMSKKQVHFPGW